MTSTIETKLESNDGIAEVAADFAAVSGADLVMLLADFPPEDLNDLSPAAYETIGKWLCSEWGRFVGRNTE